MLSNQQDSFLDGLDQQDVYLVQHYHTGSQNMVSSLLLAPSSPTHVSFARFDTYLSEVVGVILRKVWYLPKRGFRSVNAFTW